MKKIVHSFLKKIIMKKFSLVTAVLLFAMIGAARAQSESHTLKIAYSPTYDRLVKEGVVKQKTSSCDLVLTALSISNDCYHHINYSFYYQDLPGRTIHTVSALFFNDSEIQSTAYDYLCNSGVVDTGYHTPTWGGYHILSWEFDAYSNFVFSDTSWVWVSNVTSVIPIQELNENPEGVVNIFSLTGQKIKTFNSLFDERKKIPNNISPGIYILEFISENNHIVEKYGISP